jgi:hypothetical protein
MMNYINGLGLQRCIWVVAELGVADQLAAGPLRVGDLARAVDANVDAMFRVMRALAAFGIFDEMEDGMFSLNRLANCLRSDAPLSMRPWARYVGAEWHWNAWGSFMKTVKNGRTIHENIHEQSFFEHYAENGYTPVFDDAMSSVSALANPAIVAAYDFSRVHSLVDIGGGEGALLATILQANPKVQGTLYERADVIGRARAASFLATAGLAERVTFVAGSIFESAPRGKDAYLMKWILHDWNDREALLILRNIRRAASSGAKLLVAEMIVDPGNRAAKLVDLAMLALTGGRERTEAEYRGLFAKADFELRHVYPSASPYSVLEAVAA